MPDALGPFGSKTTYNVSIDSSITVYEEDGSGFMSFETLKLWSLGFKCSNDSFYCIFCRGAALIIDTIKRKTVRQRGVIFKY